MAMGTSVMYAMTSRLVREGMNQPPSLNQKAPAARGTPATSSCQPVNTSGEAAMGRRFRMRVPAAQPSPASRPSAKPSGAFA